LLRPRSGSSPIPSAHPGFDFTEEAGYLFLGFVLELEGVKIYHSGDTIIYDGLRESLNKIKPDIVFLPINGTDSLREKLRVPPNMNMDEAIALAQAVEARLLIPHHYDMFTFNTADVSEFMAKAQVEGVSFRVLRCGECFVWDKKSSSI
jgi:L-ascorbate metabolism protein UlaG (beta-lactamase superfamily)